MKLIVDMFRIIYLGLKDVIKNTSCLKEFGEKVKKENVMLTTLNGELRRMQANIDNGWRPSNPGRFLSILKNMRKTKGRY